MRSSKASSAVCLLLAACAGTPTGMPVRRAVVLDASAPGVEERAAELRRSGAKFAYWVEVARNQALADAHPEWMASLQGHQDWRRRYPDAPQAGKGEVIKCYPWVPITSREGFAAQLERVTQVLERLPPADLVLLHDLQGAPSACGCGNSRCRWTQDYGPLRTTTQNGNDAAARFVAAVTPVARGAEVIPVWMTECEADEKDTECGGVGCFLGECWKQFLVQWRPLVAACPRIAIVTAQERPQDASRFASFVAWAIAKNLPARELLQVGTGPECDVQVRFAVDQGWEPRILKLAR